MSPSSLQLSNQNLSQGGDDRKGKLLSNNSGTIDNEDKRNKEDRTSDLWTYRGKQLKHLDFPLGGIGTGNILLQGDGCLRGWDILNQYHNRDHRALHNPPPLGGGSNNEKSNNCNCWVISAAYDEDEVDKDDEDHCTSGTDQPWVVVEKLPRPSILLRAANHYGIRDSGGDIQQAQQKSTPGIPEDVPELSIRARYPIAEVSYETPPSFPLTNITMEAMTPLLPTDSKRSGYPLAVFTIGFENPHPTKSVSVDVMQSTLNFLGWDGGRKKRGVPSRLMGGNLNEPFAYRTGGAAPQATTGKQDERSDSSSSGSTSSPQYSCQGLFMHTRNELERDLTRKGSIALTAIVRSESSNSNPFDANHDASTMLSSLSVTPTIGLITGVSSEDELFRRFRERDFEDVDPDLATPPSPDGTTYAGAVVQSLSKIPPSSRASVTFCLSWHFPYRPCTTKRANLPSDFYGNLYASWFSSAREVAERFCGTFVATTDNKLRKNLLVVTRRFVETLYGSTIPRDVLESAAGRIAIARSPTLFRTEAGIVLGNEGNDCGPLNATHVFGYTTLLERIFPDLAKDMLTSVFVRNFDLNNGGCLASFGEGGFAIDGALTSIAKVYLVVKQSDPGLNFLKVIWPNLKRQLGLVLDKQVTKDGVIVGPQQTTYGDALQGANTLVGSHLLTALRATEAMANLVGDVNFAKKCSKQASSSVEGYERLCWREDLGYYVAHTDDHDRKHSPSNYSYGTGCCLDQLAGVGLSRACGFGCVFDPGREARARKSIVRHNVVTNPPFVDQDFRMGPGDVGLRVCTYPSDETEAMPCSDRVASGLEYPLVAGLIGDDNWEDAVKVCGWIRRRQSGVRQSPWNEAENGLYAARSMAGWNLFDQACGLEYNSTIAMLKILPATNAADFSCFCVFKEGFGEFKQQQMAGEKPDETTKTTKASLKIMYGSVELKTIQLDDNFATNVVASLNDDDGYHPYSAGERTTPKKEYSQMRPSHIKASVANGIVTLETKLLLEEDSILELTLSREKISTASTSNIDETVEFIVKAEEDFYLTGSENTIRRVIAETNYHCLMLKAQRFSSLFRHYAKYHGLRKDDLEYYFVNPLKNEDTPESVQLQTGDTIMVRKRRKSEPPEEAADDEGFFRDMRELLDDEEHMDAVVEVNPVGTTTNAEIEESEGDTDDIITVKIRTPRGEKQSWLQLHSTAWYDGKMRMTLLCIRSLGVLAAVLSSIYLYSLMIYFREHRGNAF